MRIKKNLNLKNIQKRLQELGYNQARLSEMMEVSRETVSKWLNSENLPLPGKLLKLSKLLKLNFEDLIITDISEQPLIAYRKNGTSKTTDRDFEDATQMALAIEALITNLDIKVKTKPEVLISPKVEYTYIKELVSLLRKNFNLKKHVVTVNDLILIFSHYNSTIIPVCWGANDRHANALRIYLNESMTTWVYINLNTRIYDFKFWLAHELGHVLAPDLNYKSAEKFSDLLAGMLLFPEVKAIELYSELMRIKSAEKKARLIVDYAKFFKISPLTVYKQTNAYCEHYNLEKVSLDNLIYQFNEKFHSYFDSVACKIFGTEEPEAEKYIKYVTNNFKSAFFIYLREYIRKANPSPTFLSILMDISFIDAQNIYRALIDERK